MKNHRVAIALAGLLFAASTSAAPLWDELLETTKRHIESQGPDSDAAAFISLAGPAAWKEHETLFRLTRRFLDGDNPRAVAGAFEVLYRLRGYRPLEWIGGPSFEEANADYFDALDKAVLGHVPHAIGLKNDEIFRSLALYLGISRAPGAHEALRKIVGLATDKEQAAICLTWHKDPSDMALLLPVMLGDSPAAASLPYHFRDAYGRAALPYLMQARSGARNRFARESATQELEVLDGAPTH